MKSRVDLYSATGVLIPGKFKLPKINKLLAAGRIQWVEHGVSAQYLYWTDAELEAERMRLYRIECNGRRMDESDEVVHLGEWRTVQYPPGMPLPSGFQLQHPRPSETRMLLEVSA